MRARNIYELELDNSIELFTESETGALDYEGRYTTDEALTLVRRLLGCESIRRPIALAADDYERYVYHARSEGRRVKLWRSFRAECGCALSEASSALPPRAAPEALRCIWRLSHLAESLGDNDLVRAERILQRSKKLAVYPWTATALMGDKAPLCLAVAWLQSFDQDKEARIDALLRGQTSVDGSFARIFDLARQALRAKNAHAYREEAGNSLVAALKAGVAIVLPLVGGFARSTEKSLCDELLSLRAQARSRAVFEEQSLSALDAKVDAYLFSWKPRIVHESENAHDRNAMRATVTDPSSGKVLTLGYLRRDVAAFIAREPKIAARLKADWHSLGGEAPELRLSLGSVQED